MSNDNSGVGGGLSFTGSLALLFIGLKLGGVIDWSWLWVLSPFWIPLALIAAVLLLWGVIAGLGGISSAIGGFFETRRRLKRFEDE